MTEAAVRASFAEQAVWCEKLGSPFTARLCRVLGATLDRRTVTGRRALDWPGDPSPSADGVPLRLCGGLHALVRSGAAPDLAPLYPPHGTASAPALANALGPILAQEDLPLWLERPPQTNEVGRSAVLMAGLLVIAATLRRPLRLLELGASAGLNLIPDHYGYDLGGRIAGNAGSPLQLRPGWSGPPPPADEVRIAGRRGVDIHAVPDPARLLPYVWPDQEERLAQAEKAIRLLVAARPTVDEDDAAAWTERQLSSATSADGPVPVVMHSVAYQYFPEATQARVAAAIAAAGARGPLAWLRMEKRPEDESYSLRLRVWPEGEDRLLAWCHPHGRAVTWLHSPAH